MRLRNSSPDMQVCLGETLQRIAELVASPPEATEFHSAEGWDRKTQLKAALPLPANDR